MPVQISLFNKSRENLGIIRLDSSSKEITFDWNSNYSQEIADAVTSILKKVREEKSVKARHEVLIEDENGKTMRVQKVENVSMYTPDFFAALTDQLNRSADLRSKIFAVLQKA